MDDPGGEVFVSPVVVVSQVFPARPGSLPDAEQFVREALEPVTLEPEENQALYQAITTAAAQRIGVSVRTISRWLRGDTEPRLRDLRKVHEVFGP